MKGQEKVETGRCPVCSCLWNNHSIKSLDECRNLKNRELEVLKE